MTSPLNIHTRHKAALTALGLTEQDVAGNSRHDELVIARRLYFWLMCGPVIGVNSHGNLRRVNISDVARLNGRCHSTIVEALKSMADYPALEIHAANKLVASFLTAIEGREVKGIDQAERRALYDELRRLAEPKKQGEHHANCG